MAKVGRFVTDPRAGDYCQVTLDSGEKIIVNHQKGGVGGALLTIERSKLLGFSSERIFTCHLETPEGQSILAWLTHGAAPGSLSATPLGAAVDFVKNAGTVAELRQLCAGLARTP